MLSDCIYNGECDGSAHCVRVSDIVGSCECNTGYVSTDSLQCNYAQKSELVTFLLSFFVGYLGADWFYLADGDAGYIVAGVFKLIITGGFGIWWLIDWIRILANAFPDGNGVELEQM
ncbi:hypothetical protein JKP88DRAFT_169122 [Tribonema minus]|uniref:TM2 domain-containing protein n=1 Tax=Tribonema minus TaxID=303371 RepID=A0A836C9M7_9STRA|nr:hypothetical protein JKP88DRAFT_169122 [Tribonema minus]